MGSNPHAIFNHHMKLLKLASCQVTSPSDKVQSHADYKILHLGCYSSPPPTQDLVPRSKQEKLGILGTEMIFTLPRCFFLRVVCPLHLEELDGLVASLALGRGKNTDWTL